MGTCRVGPSPRRSAGSSDLADQGACRASLALQAVGATWDRTESRRACESEAMSLGMNDCRSLTPSSTGTPRGLRDRHCQQRNPLLAMKHRREQVRDPDEEPGQEEDHGPKRPQAAYVLEHGESLRVEWHHHTWRLPCYLSERCAPKCSAPLGVESSHPTSQPHLIRPGEMEHPSFRDWGPPPHPHHR